ncbi:hypothetical protein F0245_23995 [Vibrio chagasii]|uniref:Uncharacterized protein n=1 Tax=Vibrio chagasii TaxID=170679 RepID=A0A7Y3YU56_9VIBR|nr:hypothetical protein [Vibrio chagasii]
MLKPSRQERANHFIQKAKLKYGERYDYSKMKYVNRSTPVDILCPEYGAFHTTPKSCAEIPQKANEKCSKH